MQKSIIPIIGIITLGIVGIFGYSSFYGEEMPHAPIVSGDTIPPISIHQSGDTLSGNESHSGSFPGSDSGIETDTLKRLETVASKTSWGYSPFGSGKPLENTGSSTDIIFHEPNTEWKSRTVTLSDGRTLNYVFGEGNPKEVEPRVEEYKFPEEYLRDGIVRPKTEKALKDFLSNPTLGTVIKKCGHLLQREQRPEEQIGIQGNFPSSLSTADFNLESMLFIDPKNGRKELNTDKLITLYVIIDQIQRLQLQCLSSHESDAFSVLFNQYSLITDSFANESDENREENQIFLGKWHEYQNSISVQLP